MKGVVEDSLIGRSRHALEVNMVVYELERPDGYISLLDDVRDERMDLIWFSGTLPADVR